MAWPTIDETKPVGTDKVKTIDDAERETRAFILSALAEVSNFSKSGTLPAAKTAVWATAGRPTGANLVDRVSGYNSTLGCEEYYDLATETWVQKAAAGTHVHAASNITNTPTGILSATDVQAAINQILSLLLPVGTVLPFAASTLPAGFLKCNGAAVSRTTYAALFTAIGTTYGVGDGSTTFNLPDLRGEFVRGWDDGRGVDSGRTIGSTQDDALESHTHSQTGATGFTLAGGAYTIPISKEGETIEDIGFDTLATGGTETRPRNVALMYCIKY